jgi:hypothetical protein
MLRQDSAEWKIISDINFPPFVTSINSVQALSTVEGLRNGFAATCEQASPTAPHKQQRERLALGWLALGDLSRLHKDVDR